MLVPAVLKDMNEDEVSTIRDNHGLKLFRSVQLKQIDVDCGEDKRAGFLASDTAFYLQKFAKPSNRVCCVAKATITPN